MMTQKAIKLVIPNRTVQRLKQDDGPTMDSVLKVTGIYIGAADASEEGYDADEV
jgi:hypothetical protein